MKQKYNQLTDAKRYQIEAYLKSGMSKKFIPKQLSINRATLYRELKRNSSKTGKYRAINAQKLANEHKERYARGRKFTREKQKIIDTYLTEEQWSP